MEPEKQREGFGSRLGFILVSAGCAIGIGNVWRFPTVTGQYGGGIFVFFYLIFLVLMGLPVLTMELAVGRAGHGAARSAYKALEPQGSKWHIHGWFCMVGCILLMMYYTTVSGWMLDYFFRFLTGNFDGLTSEQASGIFGEMLSSPVEMVFWMVIITVAGFIVCGRGLQGGLEKVGKWMMSALLALILVLVVHSFTLSGAGDGLAFYLLPDWSRASEQGLGNVITAAMNQSFFTLSLGIGAIEIFGSYMDRRFTLPGEAARICVLDTFVAVCAGLIIFPACFSFGISPDAGPSLIFITLPNVFTNMAGGRLWGTMFFLFMTFASFSTVIAVFENIIACACEDFGWDRHKACIVGTAALVLLAVVYAALYGFLYLLEQRRATAARLTITTAAMLMVVVMAVTVFAVSNLSFVSNGEATMSVFYIRTLVEAGDVERAALFLGHRHCLTQTVVHGHRLGRTLGIPTVNLTFPPQ